MPPDGRGVRFGRVCGLYARKAGDEADCDVEDNTVSMSMCWGAACVGRASTSVGGI